jgi:ribonuclease P protein component
MSRRHRLSRSRDFDAVYRHGRSVSTRYLVLYTFVRPPESGVPGEPRLGLAVSRKVGGSVQRNRLKRRLREVFASLGPELDEGRDYVLIARPGVVEAGEAQEPAWLADRVREVFDLAPREEVVRT